MNGTRYLGDDCRTANCILQLVSRRTMADKQGSIIKILFKPENAFVDLKYKIPTMPLEKFSYEMDLIISKLNSGIELALRYGWTIKYLQDCTLQNTWQIHAIAVSLLEIENAFTNLNRHASEIPKEDLYNQAISLILRLTSTVQIALRYGWPKEYIRKRLKNTWSIHKEAPFISDLNKLQKVVGDYPIIDMILKSSNLSLEQVSHDLSGILYYCAVKVPIAQQHPKKLAIQTRAYRKCCQNSKKPNILSVSCGLSWDLEAALEDLVAAKATVYLVDNNQEARDVSAKKLAQANINVTGNIRDLYRMLKKSDIKFNLICLNGLTDYLPDEHVIKLLERLIPSLAPSGSIIFTNLAEGSVAHSYWPWITVMSNWGNVYFRDEERIVKIMNTVGFKRIRCFLDPTRSVWVVKVKK